MRPLYAYLSADDDVDPDDYEVVHVISGNPLRSEALPWHGLKVFDVEHFAASATALQSGLRAPAL